MENSIEPNSSPQKHGPSLGFWVSYFYLINTMIGAGVLSIPYAYKESGWLFSLVYLTLTSIQSVVTSFLIFQILSKSQVLIREKEQGNPVPTLVLSQLFKTPNDSNLLPKTTNIPQITDRRIDFLECIRLIYGKKTGNFYSFLLSTYILGAQLGYSAVFATSMSSIVPILTLSTCNIYDYDTYLNDCKLKYWFWLFVYAVCMIFLVVRGMTEQKVLQVFLGWMRLFLIALMSVCCLVNILTEKSNTSDDHRSPQMPPLINFKQLGVIMPIVMQCSLYQECIPSIAQHIKNKEKFLPILNVMVGITTLVCYSIMGLVIPPGIQDLNSVVSLSFRNYSAGYSQSERPWWTYVIEYFIVLFPAFNVFSCFPLLALSNTNNIVTLVHGAEENKKVSRCSLLVIKLLCCLPSLLGAAFLTDLGTIIEWNGLIGFIIIPISVPLVHIGAQHLVPEQSPYRYFKSTKVSFIQVSSFSIAFLNISIVLFTILFNIKVLEQAILKLD